MPKLRTTALIPARSGSKRILNKNIKKLNGHPLLAYTISAAINSDIFDSVIVSTDSEKYKNIAESYGAIVSLRPKEYSGDNSPDINWVTHVLNELSEKGQEYDLFSILRPTSPFRMPETIKRAFNEFLKSKNVDSIRAVELCTQHPAKIWSIKNGLLMPILNGKNNDVPWHSCQYTSLPTLYSQNASLEISWTKNVKNNKSISGNRIMPFFTRGYEGVDLNHPYDWEYVNHLLNCKLAKLPRINMA